MLKLLNDKILDVEKLSWDGVKLNLAKILPDLTHAINELPDNLKFPFYKASYPFGSQIIDQNGVYLPLKNGESILINHVSLPSELKDGLGYTIGMSNPIGIILNKNCEFYLQDADKITPYTILKPGDIIGLSKNFSTSDSIYSNFLWDLVAGCKSVFMLAKISSSPQHKQLKLAYGLSNNVPGNSQDQWSVFKELAFKADSPWRTDVLFFDNQWATVFNNKAYAELQLQLAKANRPGIWHHQPSWDAAFRDIETKRHLKGYPVDILDTGRHLFSIAAGLCPGFSPATDEMSVPMKLLQDAYTNIYELEHCPIIMEPCIFSVKENTPVFYSLNCPTSPKSTPGKMYNGRSVIVNLSTLMEIVNTYQFNIQKNENLRAISLKEAAVNTVFSFYDNEYEKYSGIKNVKLLPEEDPRFICNNNSFPHHGGFLKGLVKISPREL